MSAEHSSEGAELAIRALRMRSNAAIASREVGPIVAILSADVKIVASNGSVIDGAEAMARAVQQSFADPDFVKYHREPVTVDVGGSTAAETGIWEGRWRRKVIRGSYMARWHYSTSWNITAELYVPLDWGDE
ncbi:nuclear transport factor 2 family protein [Bradyrhizobium tropiciagri]|uniref:nuclear transport factor 2 family protein n=1 Tax=Bradyrhizobium tropiciagri TaxID=312253 RepID=UPI001BAD6462|nr:nuclear transport factor 2 family protein [Bradyrhizobium tropiciagri]MBR0896772.1 nuclear transport factor 2 family protein [Bradyrhizobium tropiciagri]